MRHEGDPFPKRWFVYEDEDEYPANEGSGITSLTEAVRWVGDLLEREDDP